MPVIITSYEIAIRDRKALSKLYYKYLVVDEGHRLKNANCQLVTQLKQIGADNKLLLTGVFPPVQLLPLFHHCDPDTSCSLGL